MAGGIVMLDEDEDEPTGRVPHEGEVFVPIGDVVVGDVW
jgi:hypothetical protein